MKTRNLLLATGAVVAVSYLVSRPHPIDFAPSEAVSTKGKDEPARLTAAQAAPASKSTAFIPYGGEFWRSKPVPAANPKVDSKGKPLPANVSVPEVINRVSHAIGRKEPGVVRTPAYRAEFREDGLHFRSGDSSMHFATTGISFGKSQLPVKQVPWQFVGNTAQRVIAPGVVEHMETRREGTSVTWIMQAAPTEPAEMTIGVDIDGLSLSATSEHGSHFADEQGVSRVRIGVVTAVDSAGQKTSLQTRQTDSGLEIVVPKTLIASASYPLAIDPIVSAEIGINIAVPGVSFADAEEPDLAVNDTGDVWLLVYESSDGSNEDILGVRILNTGVAVASDVNGIAIATSSLDEEDPCVTASSGGDWFVAYIKEDAGGVDSIQSRIVGANGGVSIEEEFSIDIGPGVESFGDPKATSSGGAFIVIAEVSSTSTNGTDLVAFSLTTVSPIPFRSFSIFCNAAGDQFDPVVTRQADETLQVVWEDNRTAGTTLTDIFTATLSGGVATPTNGVAVANTAANETNPSIAFLDNGNTTALAVWTVDNAIRGSRVINGTPSASFLIDAADDGNIGPVVIGNGFEWLVVFGDRDNPSGIDALRGRPVQANQNVQTEFTILESEDLGSDYSLACLAPNSLGGSTRLVIATSEELETVTRDQILLSRLISSDEFLGTRAIVSTSNSSAQGQPAIASNGSDWLITWVDTTSFDGTPDGAGTDILATRIGANGTNRDPSGLVVSDADLNQLRPRVDAVGTTWLVVWEDWRNLAKQSDVRAARITSAGVLLDDDDNSNPSERSIIIATQATSDEAPDVAGNGARWLVVWEDNRTAGTLTDVRRTIVETNRTLSNADQIVANTADNDDEPTVAAAAGSWLVAFHTGDPASPSGEEINGFRVAADGTGAALAESISASPASDFNPEVGSNGSNYFVTWFSSAVGTVGRRVSAAGAVLPGVVTLLAENFAADTSITGVNGEWHILVEGQNDTLNLARVNAAGTLLANGIRVSNSKTEDSAMAFNPSAGFSFVVSQVQRGKNARIEVQLVSFEQAIQFASARVQFKRNPLTLRASADSGLGVTLRVLSGPASLQGNRLRMRNLGAVRVEASQGGNGQFFAADSVTRTITVIDTLKPKISKTKIKTSGEGVTFTGVAEDNHIPEKIELRFPGNSDVIKVKLKNGDRSRKSFSITTELPEGATTAQLVAIDKKGNKSRPKRVAIP